MADENFDIAIVGSGVGGLTATIAAKLAGMQPVLLEKREVIGGSSALSGGVLWLPNNPLMQRDGIADSRESALTYLANFVPEGDVCSTPARREAFVDAVAPLVELMQSQDIPLLRCDGYSDYYDMLPGGNATGRSLEAKVFNANRLGEWKKKFTSQNFPIPARASESAKLTLLGVSWEGRMKAAQVGLRAAWGKLSGQAIYSSGAALQGRLLEVALRLGCDIRVNAGLTGLETENGRVTGVHVTLDGRPETIRARRGVLISAGGFARNAAMRKQYQQEPISSDWTHANPGETGEAIEAMANAGAALGYMDESWWIPTFANPDVPEGSNQIMPELHKPHVVVVDHSGQRFVNESENYMAFGRACYARDKTVPAIPAWAVMDADHRKRYTFGFAMPGRVPKDWLKKGLAKQDNTIAGLARQCGIDPAALEATISRWNEMCETAVDEDFGKGSSTYNRYYGDPTNLPNPCMGPVAKPPYWAAPLQIGDVGTCGGAVTDEHARVLRPDGSAIDGLYASGNCAAPIAGPHYVGAGHSIGCSAIFGMLAARHMAA
ncbi:MAG: FAD-dependent oxidoreductase [Novosphingobium sp.]|nr:FAD-dependent oxidoreductase [Novosphingobium sp.]MCP5403578.1 FAD-dependent oxidoreductase [Novosphingobium sp.]